MYSNDLKSRRVDAEMEASSHDVTSHHGASRSPENSINKFVASAYTPAANFKNRKSKKEKFFGLRGKTISHGISPFWSL